MRLFDLHCDTLYKALLNQKSLNEKTDFHISVDKGRKFDRWIQCMAIWIPDDIRGDGAVQLLKNAHRKLIDESNKHHINIVKSKYDIQKQSKISFVFTVENAAALGGRLENVRLFDELGVKIVTLTWNGRNELGDGCLVNNANGLTAFGKKAISKFNANSIFIDLSHASDSLFYDAVQISTLPVLATHSNSRKVTNNPRNLTDEQFKFIKNSNGIVGLTFYKNFLNPDPEKATMYDVLRHADHFLSLGGLDNICIGSDFDGADIPDEINGIVKMFNLYELFLKNGYKEELVNKIFFDNAYKFCENFDIS